MYIISFPETTFLDCLRQVLTPDAFEAFHHGSFFDRAVFCLALTKGMLVNDERSSWFIKVGDFLMSVWDRREEILYGVGSVCEVRQSIPLQSARSMALSAMAVENE